MFAKQEIFKFEHTGVSIDEIIACAFYACAIAITKYDDKRKSFYLYWKAIALNEFRSYLRENYKEYFDYGKVSFSLDSSKKDSSLHDVIGFEDKEIKEDIVYDSLINVIHDEQTGLSEEETIVMTYYLNGYSYNDIAIICNRSLATIYRRFRSAVEKIRQKMIGSR